MGLQTWNAEEWNLRLMSKASRYHRWIYEQLRPYLRGPRVLEVGAGIGNLTSFLAESANEITCTDINPRNLAELRLRVPNLRVLADDISSTRIIGKFESIVCVNVLEHVLDDLRALQNMRDLLSETGVLLLLVPAVPALYGTVDEVDGHHRRYSPQLLRRTLLAAGLQLVRMRYMNLAGLVGWWWDSRVRRRRLHIPAALMLFDRLVPAMSLIERLVPPPIGLSLVAVTRRDSSH